ncbi:MFS transporter, DHA1 family, multidrug resistance protein [Metarhizium guizhouense ARSEF 977]|uniref:MFS transporter, DHA1 family, multidrug resistance protein n=1 Tax=Metarhizium guizhouense (strain ARSEF 977) TaxID=1276136 RepID=A0A0B4GBT1_METGA|nr:MFS transporter, DHA1 family, multidrug resistance protein [Metarhizium guizhouense ARSEF 977]
MATFLQYRAIGQRVKRQLDDIRQDGRRPFPLEENGQQPEFDTPNSHRVLIVGWDGPDDDANPRNWATGQKWLATVLVSLLALLVGVCAPIEAPIRQLAMHEFSISEMVESLSVALFLAGMGLMASALSQHIVPRLLFRFMAGFSGAAPLVCSGGTMSDLWAPKDRIYPFLAFTVVGFGTPALGPVFSAWISNSSQHHIWRWAEWIALIFSATVLLVLVAFQPETYAPVLLSWKAKHLREMTGDQGYHAQHELEDLALPHRLKMACIRPFTMAWNELTIKLASLYLSFVYAVLFTFFDGYPILFQTTYGLSHEMTFVLLAGISLGAVCSAVLGPIVHRKVLHETKQTNQGTLHVNPASRLWFAMLAAPGLPVSLFWMGWTAFPTVSIWSPLAASFLFGYSITGVFIGISMYVIDVYAQFAASAMAFTYLARYLAAAAMTVVGIPLYENLGGHWTLTLLGCISIILTPLPYVFFQFNHAPHHDCAVMA